jgi:hypothetical protein
MNFIKDWWLQIEFICFITVIMTLICLDQCQWSLMSLITGNKVKKNTQAKVLWKRKGQSQQKNFEKFKL